MCQVDLWSSVLQQIRIFPPDFPSWRLGGRQQSEPSRPRNRASARPSRVRPESLRRPSGAKSERKALRREASRRRLFGAGAPFGAGIPGQVANWMKLQRQVSKACGASRASSRQQMDGSDPRWPDRTVRRGVRSQIHVAPVVFEEAAAERHMAQLQHNIWVGGNWLELSIHANPLYQHLMISAGRTGAAS
jgi:hypothetical protein